MNELLARLVAPFHPEQVSWRVGSTTQDKKKGMALAYIDARDVMARLDSACGPENWQRRYPWSDGKRLCCEIGIKFADEWIWKSDGAGESDIEAEKGAFSDAFKRAAVNWGIGRYLYDLDSPWVELEAAGRSFKIADREKSRLETILRGKGSSAPHRPQSSPQREPEKPAVVGGDWPAYIEGFKRDFADTLGFLGASDFVASQKVTLDALLAYSPSAHAALKLWVTKEIKGKPKEAI